MSDETHSNLSGHVRSSSEARRRARSQASAQKDVSELVGKAKQGDLEAFQKLYQEFVNPLLSFVYRMIGSRTEAEDIVQDTFVAAYQNISELKEDAKFKSWLFTIARNNVYQAYRTRGTPIVSLDTPANEEEVPETERVLSKAKTPEEAVLSDELQAMIQEALTELNEKQREVFILSAIKNFSYEQIAEIVGRSVGAIKMDIHRARLVVRDKIKNYLRYN